jgi:guanylate kinase
MPDPIPMTDGPELLIVSGPSCAGKSPLCAAAKKARPELFADRQELVLYHSRARRPHEEEGEDFFFRPKEAIRSLREGGGHLVWEVREDVMAVELSQIDRKLARGRVLYEGNHRIALDLRERYPDGCLAVYLAPLCRQEVEAWKEADDASLADRLTEMMRRRLLRRTHSQKSHLGLPDLESIEARAADAIRGLRNAHRFDYVIPNHDGEDSDHWRLAEHPIGDARLAVEALCAAMSEEDHPYLERWGPGLVPGED